MPARQQPVIDQTPLLNAALESMPYGLSIWAKDFTLVLWNDRYHQIYRTPGERLYRGMPLKEICALTIAAGNHTDTTVDGLYEIQRQRLEASTDGSKPTRYDKDLNGRIIRTTYLCRPDIGWVLTHEDITDDVMRMRYLEDREEQLALQNMRFHAAVENMSQGLCMFDASHRLVICNADFARMYELPQALVAPATRVEDIMAFRVETGIPEHESEKSLRHAASDHEPSSATLELGDGRIIAVRHHPMTDGGWVSTHQDITAQRRIEERIRHLARHDSLTDLPNRHLFHELLEAAEQRIKRGETLALLSVDLDHFKVVNDGLGHGIGDVLLQSAARRLAACCGPDDTVARLGGDEFAILTGPIADPNAAAQLADRIVTAMAEPFDADGHCIVIGASVGITIAPTDGTATDTLLKNADLALYRAKNDGRGAYHFFERGMDETLQRRRALEIALREAMANHEFRLVFQPLVNLERGRICGVEALLRWYHPDRGTIPPNEFIPVAEESGLIVAIGEWVLREACRAAASWPSDIHVAVNLSTVQFRNRSLVHHVEAALHESGLDPRRLELEVTESLLLADSETTLHILHEIRRMGVRVSMDDFGTGYSSLSYLRSFPFDKIKIDQSFVRDLAKEDSRAIVKAVIGLGRSLGMSTTAEGVETEAQLELVRQQGCTEVQGFLFSPPLPATALDKLFVDHSGSVEWKQTLRRVS